MSTGKVPRRLSALPRWMAMLIIWPKRGQHSGHVKRRPIAWKYPEKLGGHSDLMTLVFQPQTAQTHTTNY